MVGSKLGGTRLKARAKARTRDKLEPEQQGKSNGVAGAKAWLVSGLMEGCDPAAQSAIPCYSLLFLAICSYFCYFLGPAFYI